MDQCLDLQSKKLCGTELSTGLLEIGIASLSVCIRLHVEGSPRINKGKAKEFKILVVNLILRRNQLTNSRFSALSSFLFYYLHKIQPLKQTKKEIQSTVTDDVNENFDGTHVTYWCFYGCQFDLSKCQLILFLSPVVHLG